MSYLASLFDIPEEEIDVTLTFEQYGLDSAAAVALVTDLAKWLNMKLDLDIVEQHATIASISALIERQLAGG